MKKVYVICTGGTIGMEDVSDRDPSVKRYVFEDEIRKSLPASSDFPVVTFNIYHPQIDSTEMRIDNWNKIALDIFDNYEKYDGFIILHGTDTMAYTGSALSFMLDNLSKPVILTGAQTPLSHIVNDARENLINAIYIAGNYPINEVCIYFNQSLFRANRTTKLSTINYSAYTSPDFPTLGEVGSTIKIKTHKLLPTPCVENLKLSLLSNVDIRYILIMPNLEAHIFKKLIDGAAAVIIGTYGDGNMPVMDATFLQVIAEAMSRGTIFVNKSQCLHSKTSSHIYDGGKALEKIGVISSSGQTVESLLCKLLYLHSLNLSIEKIKIIMQMNLRGELTPSTKSPFKCAFYQPANTTIFHQETHEIRSLGFIKAAL